ncbi:hypothetical protein FOMPIDRAFT_1109755 [Fomitopsis schrenkii]|uniref:Uncharacterized protein n=1 Tax=Fomitopsis schrenkii TaxID=2126942 RepID=S8ELC9_FOMSC|nr:hypothetical protein FOMPIDRAFT_1109755 [Fomitopsis schrenkii]
MNRDVARVDVRIAGLFLDRLANRVREQTGEARVSRQDCLTAYVATVLNQCGAGPIDTVTNAASYRNVVAPFVNPDVAVNSIYIVRTELERGAEELLSIASAIRRSIEKWTEPSLIAEYISVASQMMLDAVARCSSLRNRAHCR